MKTCPTCGIINPDTATVCECGSQFAKAEFRAPIAKAGILDYLAIAGHLGVFGGAVLAAEQLMLLQKAQSAPQQAAAASMACAFVVIPYCLGRAIGEIARHVKGK